MPSDRAEMETEIVRSHISIEHVEALAIRGFGDFVKAVVDVAAGVMAIGGELHADEEAILLDHGSRQADLWGINLRPANFRASGFVEFDSMINLRPSQGNRTRSVDDPAIRQEIESIVGRLIQ